MNPLIVTGIWCLLTLGAEVFLLTEAVRSLMDYRFQKRADSGADGDMIAATRLLARKSVVLAIGMLFFFAAGSVAFIPPYSTPPPGFELKSAVVQLLLIAGQVFYFLDGVYLFMLRRLAKDSYRSQESEREKLELTRDELTEEIRENRRIFAELGDRVEKSLTAIHEELDKKS